MSEVATLSRAETARPHHGGQLLIDQLAAEGVERAYCIPGESYLAALDGMVGAGIELVVCRQEGGAAMMAEAHGKLTGRPGVAFVTRGPGATNASAGVHVAFQDSTPMVLFVGQVARDQRDREAFQEVDYRAMFGPLAKWVAEIELTERIPEYVSHAFHVAQSGRPGPVVLALPEDMLSAEAHAPIVPPATMVRNDASEQSIDAIVDALAKAKRPLAIVGGGGWSAATSDALARFASAWDLPVAASFRCQDYLDNRLPQYVGDAGVGVNPKLAEKIREADLILTIGARLGEMTTSGYTLLNVPEPKQTLIHVHPDTAELGRVYRPAVAVAAGSEPVLEALAARKAPQVAWGAWREAARAVYEGWQMPQATPGALQMEYVIQHLNEALGDDAILTNGAGNYSAWLHRYYRYRSFRTQLAPTSGSMGYGLPAAVAAKLAAPERDVVCLAGDGCFQMTCQEFGTACEYGANIIVLISNNGMYGTIRMHQEREYPGRVSGTKMRNPDFAAWARSYGAFGETVTDNASFADALARARASGMPSILDLKVDPRALSPRMTL
ncbi:thiamine pyrophosphate-binding protein [Acuticoccus kandeliae]|uniref:thiamine pyrophosphate-binding protein n=1 Tax=Acuticoccus kandeliae TaxID=2073160 RepID=UPI000D3E7EB9|nr:thiamine pyrophosphate-binding protein [Acuticoccus kandeliae]